MKKSDLKRLIKPIVKECVNEALIEQGVLSNIISEVVQGLQLWHQPPSSVHTPPPASVNQKKQLQEHQRELEYERHQHLKEQKRRLLDAAGFGTDIFAGSEPIQEGIVTEAKESSQAQAGALAGVEPTDAGVDISGIMALGGRDWGKMI